MTQRALVVPSHLTLASSSDCSPEYPNKQPHLAPRTNQPPPLLPIPATHPHVTSPQTQLFPHHLTQRTRFRTLSHFSSHRDWHGYNSDLAARPCHHDAGGVSGGRICADDAIDGYPCNSCKETVLRSCTGVELLSNAEERVWMKACGKVEMGARAGIYVCVWVLLNASSRFRRFHRGSGRRIFQYG